MCAHDVLDSFIAPCPISLALLDCAFYIPPIFCILTDYLFIISMRFTTCLLWVFSRFLVSSPGASWPGRRRSRRLTFVNLCSNPGKKTRSSSIAYVYSLLLKSWSSSLQFSVVESSLAGGLVAERRAVAVLYGLRLHRRVEYTPLF